ncbi:MAG: transposase [Nitrospirae bacterium]|nr:transposase [Nitrospirota bacterium]
MATENEENLTLMRLIDEEYTRHPFFGSRKMVLYLSRNGHNVNRKHVQRLMRLMGLVSIAPRKRTSIPAENGVTAKNKEKTFIEGYTLNTKRRGLDKGVHRIL